MSMTTTQDPTSFAGFELHELLEQGLDAAGFATPRPIQRETIPAALEGEDVLGLAQTGTGKTAAFTLPILDRLLERRKERPRGPRALVIAPTRELATQIADEMRMLGRFTKLKVVTIYGGVSAQRQIQNLHRKPEIIVGCPGRLLDLLQQRKLRLDGIETLVLDEADLMFDMGFLPDIKRLMKAVPEHRQTLLFSATMPKEVRGLADEVLDDPCVVELATSAPASTIDHALFPVAETRKRDLLNHLLEEECRGQAIVFTRTKHRARRLADQLSKAGHKAVGLQGNLSQNARARALKGFRDGQFDILVATDIAARGIDVSGVSHVINFDVPSTPEAYTHRIGRTGRSESEGVACTFVTGQDNRWVKATEKMIGEKIARRRVDGFDAREDQRAERAERSAQRRGNDRPKKGGNRPPRGQERRERPQSGEPQGSDGRRDERPRRGPRTEGEGRPQRRPFKRRKPADSAASRPGHEGGPRREESNNRRGQDGPRHQDSNERRGKRPTSKNGARRHRTGTAGKPNAKGPKSKSPNAKRRPRD